MSEYDSDYHACVDAAVRIATNGENVSPRVRTAAADFLVAEFNAWKRQHGEHDDLAEDLRPHADGYGGHESERPEPPDDEEEEPPE